MTPEQVRYINSFYVKITFNGGDVKYLDAHSKTTDEIHLTSLISCYKAVVRFICKPRKNPLLILDCRQGEDRPNINASAYEPFGNMEIRFIQNGEEKELVRRYTLLKGTATLFNE